MKTVVRWTGAVIGALVLAFLIVIAWGSSLPIHHTASCDATLRAPVDAVWNAIADERSAPAWRSDLARVDAPPAPNPPLRFTEVEKSGMSLSYTATFAPQSRTIVHALVATPSMGFAGKWTYELGAAGSGTSVSVREDGDVYNPVFRFITRYFAGYTSTMSRYLADLGTRFHEQPPVRCAVGT